MAIKESPQQVSVSEHKLAVSEKESDKNEDDKSEDDRSSNKENHNVDNHREETEENINPLIEEYEDYALYGKINEIRISLYEMVVLTTRGICSALAITIHIGIPLSIFLLHWIALTGWYIFQIHSKSEHIEWLKILKFTTKKGLYGVFLPGKKTLSRLTANNAAMLIEDSVMAGAWTLEYVSSQIIWTRIVIFCILCVVDVVARLRLRTNKENNII